MSRSYKHTPRSGQQKDRYFKKYANRKLRKFSIDDLPKNGNGYKKVFCHYDICDYETVGTSFEQYWASVVDAWHNWFWKYEPFPDKDETYEEYRRNFLRK